MSRPSKSDRKKPGPSESFEERIDILFEELSFAIQQQRPSILLVFYEEENVRDRVEGALEKRLAEVGQALVPFPVDEMHFDIPLMLSQRLDRDGSVYSVTGLSRGGGKEAANAYRALNIRREYFVDYVIRVILWLAGDEAIELSRHAPDFWAFRHRVVEFNDAVNLEHPGKPANELDRGGQGFPARPDDLDEQIEWNERQLAGLPEQTSSFERRLELLFRLAGLYQVKKDYDRSIRCLKDGVGFARELNNLDWLAKFWGNLGLVYLDLEQPLRAVRACRKAIRFNPTQAGLWCNLGHLYYIEKRFSDAIIAYKNAIQLDPQNYLANSSLEACYRLSGKAYLPEEHKKRG